MKDVHVAGFTTLVRAALCSAQVSCPKHNVRSKMGTELS